MRVAIIENKICTNIVIADNLESIDFIPGKKIESQMAQIGWIYENEILIAPDEIELQYLEPLICPNCSSKLDDNGKCISCGYQL